MRQLVREIMLSKGMTPEEIDERGKYASSMAPNVPVDNELPEHLIPALRKKYTELYDAVQARPAEFAEWMEQKTDEIRRKN